VVLETFAAVAQILSLGVDIVEPQRWFRPTDVRLGRVGPNGLVMGGSYASVRLDLGLASRRSPARMPSVLILMHGGPWGITDEAATWTTRVRLGGSYLFHVPPGTYSMAALYIAAQTHHYVSPALLAVGESFAEVVIGDRRSVPLPGRPPTTAHLAAMVKAPESIGGRRSVSLPSQAPATAQPAAITKAPEPPKSFVIPEGATQQTGLGKDWLYQCVAMEGTSPSNRCRSSQRGALVCAKHGGLSVVQEAPKSFVIPEGATQQTGLGKDWLYQCVAMEGTSPSNRCRNSQRGALVCAKHKQVTVTDQ
jgi:hypothetical protein